VLRWLLFAALAVMAGEAAGILLTRRHQPAGTAAPRSWALPAALAGTVASLGLVALIVGDGSVLDGFSHAPGDRLSGRAGVLALVEFAAFAVAAVLAAVRPRWPWVPLAAVAVAEGIRAHPEAFEPGWGAPVTMVHVAAAAVWIGALLHVGRCMMAWRAVPGAAWGALGSYAWLAGGLFGAVMATGVLSALIVVPLHAWATGYGWLLLAKLVLVTGVAGCALTARGRMRRRAEQGRTLRWMRVETGLLAGVLAVAATLTAAAPPRQSG
jgi:copper transport protein